jgi:hypothetical protein
MHLTQQLPSDHLQLDAAALAVLALQALSVLALLLGTQRSGMQRCVVASSHTCLAPTFDATTVIVPIQTMR